MTKKKISMLPYTPSLHELWDTLEHLSSMVSYPTDLKRTFTEEDKKEIEFFADSVKISLEIIETRLKATECPFAKEAKLHVVSLDRIWGTAWVNATIRQQESSYEDDNSKNFSTNDFCLSFFTEFIPRAESLIEPLVTLTSKVEIEREDNPQDEEHQSRGTGPISKFILKYVDLSGVPTKDKGNKIASIKTTISSRLPEPIKKSGKQSGKPNIYNFDVLYNDWDKIIGESNAVPKLKSYNS